MSEIDLQSKLQESNKLPKISSLENCVFNSKLFIDLDSTYEQSLNNSLDKDSENSSEFDDIDRNSFLIKELMDELDFPRPLKKEENRPLLALVNKRYEFIPKSFRNSGDNNLNNKKAPKVFNKYNMIHPEDNFNKYDWKVKHKSIKERKGDWFCILCNNLNFAFRTKCNRCKVAKEDCAKK